jgi:lipoprotein NlpD
VWYPSGSFSALKRCFQVDMYRPFLLVMMVLCCLSGCGSNPPAPVRDETTLDGVVDDVASDTAEHRVQKGETLYSISWRYGVDFAQLAAWNDLSSPFMIYPGQTLTLRADRVSGRSDKPARGTPERTVRPTPPSPRTTDAESGVASDGVVEAVVSVAPRANGRWQWPTRGAIVRAFNAKGSLRGIHIAGDVGQDVAAVAPGQVVYSGNGLAGYGNLIIIKHDRHYLSAYGYNRRLLVREGDVVKGRQKIAEMGVSSGGRGILYFEIRRDGKPIDPLAFLSKR